MTTRASTIPLLIEKVFARIENDLKLRTDKALSDTDFIELHSLFGNLLDSALNILDTSKIILNQSQKYCRELIEISRFNRVYHLFPDVNYCPCLSFQYQVITSQTQSTCKHVLAVKLAQILGKIQVRVMNDEQFDFLIKQIAS